MTTFLPQLFELNSVLLFGMFLLLGLVGGTLAHRSGWVPKITGYMAVGLLVGPGGLGLLTPTMVDGAQIFVELALGMILFDLGRQLNLRDLMHERGLVACAVGEMAFSFVLVGVGMWLLGLPLLWALLMAALGVSSSPTITMMVVREFDGYGPVTTRSLGLLALNNIGAFVLFTLLLPWMYAANAAHLPVTLLHPVYLLVGSVAVAYVMYLVGRVMVSRLKIVPETQAFALVVALLLVGIGLSKFLGLSSLLTSLLLGVMVATLAKTKPMQDAQFGVKGDIFFIILFVIAGARLHLHDAVTYAPFALAFVGLRCGGKWLGLQAAGRWCQMGRGQLTSVAGMLVPMAGLAIGLSQTTENLFPALGHQLVLMILAGVAILESIGPAVSELALRKAGEMHDFEDLGH